MPTYTYTLIEYDEARPWIITSTRTGLTVDLEKPSEFHAWASNAYPGDRWKATLDPGQGG